MGVSGIVDSIAGKILLMLQIIWDLELIQVTIPTDYKSPQVQDAECAGLLP